MGRNAGAGEGNRTLVVSLEGFCSTIELHPPRVRNPFLIRALGAFKSQLNPCGGEGWIRTNVGARPTDLQSAPFNHSGTSPRNSRLCQKRGDSGKWNRSFLTEETGGCGVPAPRIERGTYRLQGGCSTS